MTRTLSRTLAGVALALGMAASAQATLVTMDFSSGVWDGNYNYSEDGFRIKPQVNDHFENYSGVFNWHDGSGNIAPNVLRLDFANGSGAAFAAMSVQIVNLTVGAGGIVFRDSFGNQRVATSTGLFNLNFLNTTYLEFQVLNTGNNDYPISIDNLVLNTQPQGVPAPGTLALLGLGLLGLASRRRTT